MRHVTWLGLVAAGTVLLGGACSTERPGATGDVSLVDCPASFAQEVASGSNADDVVFFNPPICFSNGWAASAASSGNSPFVVAYSNWRAGATTAISGAASPEFGTLIPNLVAAGVPPEVSAAISTNLYPDNTQDGSIESLLGLYPDDDIRFAGWTVLAVQSRIGGYPVEVGSAEAERRALLGPLDRISEDRDRLILIMRPDSAGVVLSTGASVRDVVGISRRPDTLGLVVNSACRITPTDSDALVFWDLGDDLPALAVSADWTEAKLSSVSTSEMACDQDTGVAGLVESYRRIRCDPASLTESVDPLCD